MAFWTSTIEPKRQFRFKVEIVGMAEGATWYVDPSDPDAAAEIFSILKAAGYDTPKAPGGPGTLDTVGKRDMVAGIQGVIITQLDSNGVAQETWTLNNPIIKSIGLGDLSYESEDLSTIEIAFAYDWCTFESAQLKDDLFAVGAE